MADSKDYVTVPAEKGSINISEEVLASVIANAVLDTEGVAALGRDTGELWGKKPAFRGIRIVTDADGIHVEVSVLAKLGAAIHEMGAKLQEAVAVSVEGVTGVKVSEVNVRVIGVQTGK